MPAVRDFDQFTVTVANRGPDQATGILVNTGFLADVVTVASARAAESAQQSVAVPVISSSASQGTYDGAAFTWSVGTLAKGETAVLTGLIEIAQPEVLRNQAVKSHTEPDPNPANDRDAVTVRAVGLPDLQVTKSASSQAPEFGEHVTFVVTVRNNGPVPADGVVLLDPIPPGLVLAPDSEMPVRASRGAYD